MYAQVAKVNGIAWR